MNKTQIEVFINNNPKCIASIESTAKNEMFEIENTPYIEVKAQNINNGVKSIVVESYRKKLHDSEIEVTDNKFEIKVYKDNPFESVDEVTIHIDDQRYDIELNLNKISGRVMYFDGRPVENPILNITGKDIAVVGDSQGNYEISICGKEKQIGVFDKNYSKETLEAWLYNVDIENDIELDVQIDKMELYGINMWPGEMSDYVHFIPMSLSRYQEAAKRGFGSELDLLKYDGVWPKLSREDVKVSVNGENIKFHSFQEVPDFLVEVDDTIYSRPSYVISIPKGYSDSIIKLEIENRFNTENGEILEKGEGYYFW
ncbi:hypothetical protein EZV73_01905 [Acidaminobacter sp. JC074]|uniref:hypothetical protein n=1 Tax=Acidaminobacter sp. JC074 TaxID=2530199 RepID=UPI001F11881D|nr:hypothetical protein [Acidaminobacter sp. JC074]MCH4886299.1 hypothetical protein [Acidaminobacter sp. JC074]